MPKVTIYIRKDDEAKWKAIENKPEWLHQSINTTTIIELVSKTLEAEKQAMADEFVKTGNISDQKVQP